ncbi:hypothetical protein PF007_g23522 [Phytophthora fragariae]|uniref:Uncharacterized protein n=1 Tax=Phytophthora fragariae TaxID=53985 RepID=A0A6A3QPF9_9STRA|nr:hypothetical protein PF003_g38925 [Phytophthora fragariae]KAE9079257.1 hypothetical protein PF007_g23522 [Phytophthora fragariae]KAE9100983.1 hypothetical protein PF006_g22774 [Phytophthora fragariae]
MMFVGFTPPANAIPSGYKWRYKISPLRYPLSTIVSLVFADCNELPRWDDTAGAYINVGLQLGCQPMANAPNPRRWVVHATDTTYSGLNSGVGLIYMAALFNVV